MAKIRILLLLFCFVGVASFAQRFGVDAGYAYAWNSFKDLDSLDHTIYEIKEKYKQASFPNFSFGAYIRVYKKVYFCLGADLVKYELKKDIAYHGYNQDRVYHYNFAANEIHIPAMIRVEALRIKEKHRLSFYGGMFARVLGMRKTAVTMEPDYHTNGTLVIYKKKQQYTCFTAGAHQAFSLNSFFECYIDARFKYMPGYYYSPSGPATIQIYSLSISNHFAFSLSAGVSFILPDKEKSSNTNPARLQD
jgi:hypothetical protein